MTSGYKVTLLKRRTIFLISSTFFTMLIIHKHLIFVRKCCKMVAVNFNKDRR